MSENQLPEELAPLADVIHSFDHVAFAVRDLVAAVSFFQAFGGQFIRGGDARRMGFRWVQFMLPGETKVEAISPVDEACFLHDFLDRRGEGLHHLTFRVTDLVEAAKRAEASGLRVVGLWADRESWKECFIHPASAHGTVIQLAQWLDKDQPPPSLEAVLAGEIFSAG